MIAWADDFAVDPQSPSGLAWTKGNRKSPPGSPVGTIAHGYWIVGMEKTTYRVHRIIWELVNGEIPDGMVLDHVDGDRGNNRLENLRLASKEQNSQNRTGTTAIAKNVYETRPGYFQVKVAAYGKKLTGSFVDATEAIWTAHLWRLEVHGGFAKD